MKQILPYLLCTVGGLVAFFCFVASLGSHSIDPTPQIRALESAQANRFFLSAVAGFLLFVSGVLWIIVRSVSSHRKTGE